MESEEEDSLKREEQLLSRPYQTQLEEIAITRNTIIHLPTGSGKTFIAINLIKRFRQSLRPPWGQGGKRTFFLVNTVPLVTQQKKVVESLCPVDSVAGYSGEDGVDYWNKDKWDQELSKNQVIVMTAQILFDMLTHAYIKIEDINLLIFDECHHAVSDHPMRMIMSIFQSCPVEQQPRILGLTATLLNANVDINKVRETLRELETTFHATIATVNELGEVLSYSTNPHEVIMYYTPPAKTAATNEAIDVLNNLQTMVLTTVLPQVSGHHNVKLERWQQNISCDPYKVVKEVKNMIVSMVSLIEELGVYGGCLGILSYIIVLERLKRKALTSEEEKLYKIVITHALTARMILLNSMTETGYEKIRKHSSEKFLHVLDILKEYNPKNYTTEKRLLRVNLTRKTLSAIIFTKQRFTAKVLYNLLKDVKETNPEEFGFLKHDFVVGFNINPAKCTREQHYNKKATHYGMLKFSKGELNCIISTSVIEEGVDIPQCLLVLRYDAPLEYRSYIQSKGRARSSESSFVILVDSANKAKFVNQYRAYQSTEKHIQQLLVGFTDEREAPTEQEIEEMFGDEEIPPYVTANGNRLLAVSAISLLNRYCMALPHDQFTVITPLWVEEKLATSNGVRRVVKIHMPLACPIKEIISGEPMANLKSAKRAAALKACIKLHQVGELDPITLLPRRYGVVNFDQADVRACFLNWPWDQDEDEGHGDVPKPGTKKRVRKHAIVFPPCLKGSNITNEGQPFFLHIIKLTAKFEEPQTSREKALYDLIKMGRGYGILTQKSLPALCDFPLFLTIGEVQCSLEMNYASIQLNKKLFDLIKRFHYFVFDQVLETAKKFNVFDGKENAMYVVPVVSSSETEHDIDWEVMQTHDEIPEMTEPSFDERRSINVTPESYNYHVVSPWYRGCISPPRYLVTKVVEYKTPSSAFDNDMENGTYADYYASKYNLEVLVKDQPLLEVRNITTRMNCLLPRAATLNAFTDKQKKQIALAQGDDKPKSFPETFIPEFCVKYDYPGVLWYKATLLPCIVHRLKMLLVANDLRVEIAMATGVGQTELLKEETWLPIQVDFHSTVKGMLKLIEQPNQNTAIDRINNPRDEEAPRLPKVMTMKETLYELQLKKISEEYPWDEHSEPIDIERNISQVTVMDIECYDEFMSMPMPIPDTAMRSPPRVLQPPPGKAAAILPPPVQLESKIKLLSKKPTNRGPELREILKALTTINSHDSFDLERVETLGDSFLKFASSLYLFHKFPRLNEGQLTNIKGRFLGNRNLYYAGTRVNLGGRMKIEQFSPKKDFLVPGFFAPAKVKKFIEEKKIRPTFLFPFQYSLEEILTGELSPESWKAVHLRYDMEDGTAEPEPFGEAQNSMQCYIGAQAVADKSIADCVEALIGTYLLSDGIIAAVKVLEWLRVLPPQDNFKSYLTKKIPTVLTENPHIDCEEIHRVMNHCGEDVERIMGYKFKDPSLLLEALSHSSYIRNRFTRSYERLEFLGDAILDFLITSHVYETCGDLKPGELTDLRSALVNNVTFASYVVKLGLHKFIGYQLNPSLERAIIAFVEHQDRRNHEIVDDVLYLIDEEDCQVAEYVEVPKVLSDIFESLAGAIFLDSGGDLEAVWAVYYRIMCREIYNFSRRVPLQPVKVLHEMIHACPMFEKPIVSTADQTRVMVPVTVTKEGRQHTVYGFGGNKNQAKRAAAKLALKLLSL